MGGGMQSSTRFAIGKGDKGGRGLGDKWFRGGGGGVEGAEVWRRDLN